jgi:hypothetical protein
VTYRLTFNDAVDIWLRHWAGEYQHTIAARYDVSRGRVNASGRRHAAEQRDELAPFHCPMPPVLRIARHDSPIAG